ncbi:TPA: hypothetical protein JA361_08535 [Legionella pneumophila]|nr:hypothetical protein [Legionella pneumophila]HAT8182741.1 hypothetical protein [Legionella pneumophila]
MVFFKRKVYPIELNSSQHNILKETFKKEANKVADLLKSRHEESIESRIKAAENKFQEDFNRRVTNHELLNQQLFGNNSFGKEPAQDQFKRQFSEVLEQYEIEHYKRLQLIENINTPEKKLGAHFQMLAKYGVTDETYPIIETLKKDMSTQPRELSDITSEFLEGQRLHIERQLEDDRFSNTSSPN